MDDNNNNPYLELPELEKKLKELEILIRSGSVNVALDKLREVQKKLLTGFSVSYTTDSRLIINRNGFFLETPKVFLDASTLFKVPDAWVEFTEFDIDNFYSTIKPVEKKFYFGVRTR